MFHCQGKSLIAAIKYVPQITSYIVIVTEREERRHTVTTYVLLLAARSHNSIIAFMICDYV